MLFCRKSTFNNYLFLFFLLFIIVIFNGCTTVALNYIPPKSALSPEWHAQLKGGLNVQGIDPQKLATWWTTLNDSLLSQLIERAVSNNLDIKKALARVREARARRGLAKADLFPTLEASGSATWSHNSNSALVSQNNELYAASFDAKWELDIFGGVQRSVEAAKADLQATIEDLRDVFVSLLAEVALNYLEVRTFQSRLKVAEANLVAQNETYQLTLWRYEAGLSDELAVQQALYNLESTRSQIPTLRIGLEEAKNRLAVLIGEKPGSLPSELDELKPIPVPPMEVAIGIPADVLRRRPDVRRAERQLAAQTARVGVAAADLYPKFTLNGSIGLEALSISSLFTSAIWSISGGPKITWAIFKGGAIRQNIEVQSAIQEQYLIAYETAVLNALEEVENALVSYGEEQQRREDLWKATRAAQMAVELAQHKYQTGLTDFSNVLDAERSLLSMQDQLVQSEGKIASNLVRLYKALGGGWTSLVLNEKKTVENGEKK